MKKDKGRRKKEKEERRQTTGCDEVRVDDGMFRLVNGVHGGASLGLIGLVCLVVLVFFGDGSLGGDHEAGNTCGMDEGHSDDLKAREEDYLGGVDDSGFDHVDLLSDGGVKADARVAFLEELVDDHGA